MGQPANVLIVDDEQSIRTLLRALLEDLGYGVAEAANGREGLEVFDREHPDLVLADLNMPVMDGLAMISELREKGPAIPVIVVSGTATVSSAVDSLRLGAWDYVVKPVIDLERFRITIDRTLEKARLMEENRRYREHLEELVRERTEELRMSEARYRRLLESVTSYVYTVFVKAGLPDRTVHGPGCEAVTGFGPEEYAADPFLWYRMVYDDDRPPVVDMGQRILGESLPISLEHRIYHKTGTIRWVQNTLVPHSTPEGELVSYDGIIVDITDRKRAEEALRRAEEKYRHIFENAVEGIFQSTPDGRYITANPALARMHGYASLEEMIADAPSIVDQVYVTPALREEFQQKLEKDGEIKGFEVECHRKDGGTFYVSVSARAVRDDEGATLYYEGTSQDITERMEVERQRLRVAQLESERKTIALETLGQLMVTLSHYLLNTNAIIGGMARRCERVKTDVERISALRTIGEQARKTEAIIAALRKITEIRTTDYAGEGRILMIDLKKEIDEALAGMETSR
jgi:sigma-B regulation protein RsbU (phosphoserine phosphatase)